MMELLFFPLQHSSFKTHFNKLIPFIFTFLILTWTSSLVSVQVFHKQFQELLDSLFCFPASFRMRIGKVFLFKAWMQLPNCHMILWLIHEKWKNSAMLDNYLHVTNRESLEQYLWDQRTPFLERVSSNLVSVVSVAKDMLKQMVSYDQGGERHLSKLEGWPISGSIREMVILLLICDWLHLILQADYTT